MYSGVLDISVKDDGYNILPRQRGVQGVCGEHRFTSPDDGAIKKITLTRLLRAHIGIGVDALFL